MFAIVAENLERARHELRESSLNPKEAVLLTPNCSDRVRGCRLAFVIWADEWWRSCSVQQALDLYRTIEPALIA